jgi:tRNA threonylcarbamoyladenosine biosynthesis protein TsaE
MKIVAAETVAHSIEDTQRLAAAVAAQLQPGDVLCLYGQLGAGKTYFTKGLVAGLGGDAEAVTSPTFVLMQIYGDKLEVQAGHDSGEPSSGDSTGREPSPRLPVYHFDAYRLRSADDLLDIGSDETLSGDGVSVIEWADRVAEAMPPDRLDVELTPTGATERRIRLTGHGAHMAAVVAQLTKQGLASYTGA